jgi:chemotaxis protein CheC
MQLTSFEEDALNELFNVGLHRAAAALSRLTGKRIEVDLPQLWIVPTSEVEPLLDKMLNGDLATVHQVFHGAIAGDAVFLLEYAKAAALAALLSDGEAALGGRVDQAAREVLTEIGNIILGACLSAFGDVLKVAVSFSVPRIQVESLSGLLGSMTVDQGGLQYALVAATHFQLQNEEVGGYLVVAIGVNSIEAMARTLTSSSCPATT